jgi:ectoine hydroxylase-related dioxygenase (phytanoyl-CoA dioxygenase family)
VVEKIIKPIAWLQNLKTGELVGNKNMIMLNEQELYNWKYRGFTILPIFSEHDCQNIKFELDRLRIIRNSKDFSWGEYDMYSHPQKDSELILKLFGHPQIIDTLEKIMGDEVEGIQSLAYFKPPNELGRDNHQDGFYTQSGWGKSINVIISLDSMDETNGCLYSYECSHFLPILPIEIDEERAKTNPSFWRNERGKACVMPENHYFNKVNHVCKVGDVLFAHDHLVHGSGENKSNRYRRSIVLSYKTKGAPIRQGTQMKREPFDVYEIRKKYWGI